MSAPSGLGNANASLLADEPDPGWRRTSPLGILALGLRSVSRAILPAAALSFGVEGWGMLAGLLLVCAIVVASLLGAAIVWWRTQYRIGSSDIRLHKGFIGRSARSVPIERIQDVSLEQGLLPRLLGLVEVRFETGAGGKDELQLAYVTLGEGEALRESVRARMDLAMSEESTVASDDYGAPRDRAANVDAIASRAAAETNATTLLFAMSMRRIALFGLFEFSLIVFAVLGGAAQQLDFLLPFDVWDLEHWEERLSVPNALVGAWLSRLGWLSRIFGVLVALALLGAVGLATGLVRTFAREYGFRLERTPRGFRRRRGLLTRTDVVMPEHRVQAVTVSTGLLRRIWGWHSLAFISLAQDAGSANHTVVPFARMQEIAPIAFAAGFSLPDAVTDWHRPTSRYRLDRAVLEASILLVVAIGPLAFGGWTWALGALLVAAANFVRHYCLWRCERHALDDRQVIARTGWLIPQIKIAMRVKLHSIEIRQGPLGRRRGYTDLRFGLAGGALILRGLALADAQRMRAAILDSITGIDFSDLSA